MNKNVQLNKKLKFRKNEIFLLIYKLIIYMSFEND